MYCIHIKSDIDRLKAENEYLNSLLTPEIIRKRIIKSCEDLNKLNSKMQISISPGYLDLKLQKMNLCYEYAMKKQEEKEEQKRIREEQREAQKSQREIEEELKQIDYREANQRAGYVYIISNIGSFGENIYKIGMTRRLDTMDRVDELGDASVPFRFDVHAMIFSDDAPALEAALHRAFDDRKVNMVNTRREFFHVTLEEIEEVVRKNYDKTVEFTKLPNAEQYRESQMIRKGLGQAPLSKIEPNDNFTQTVQTSHTTQAKTIKSNTVKLDPNKEYLRTKWGIYEMPEHYTIKMSYGKRTDLKQVN